VRSFVLRIFVTALAALVNPAAGDVPAVNAELEAGYTDMYNLQFDAAHAAFKQYEQANPEDAMGPVSDAAAYLFFELDRMKILRSDFFVENHTLLNSKKVPPNPEVKKQFEAALAKAKQLAEARLQKSPGDHNALLANVLGTALHANYEALIGKQYWQALTEIKEAQVLAEQLLRVCPDCHDADLAGGVENYLLSQKMAAERWLLRLTGAQTDKQAGIEKLRTVAEKGLYLKPYAKILLAIAALRDNNKAEAKELLAELAGKFPRNDLFREELKKLSSGSGCCGCRTPGSCAPDR